MSREFTREELEIAFARALNADFQAEQAVADSFTEGTPARITLPQEMTEAARGAVDRRLPRPEEPRLA